MRPKFCARCANVLYPEIANANAGPDPTPRLTWRCRSCGAESQTSSTSTCVLETLDAVDDDMLVGLYVNEHTVLDPTVPRMLAACPGCRCARVCCSVKYNCTELKFVYVCTSCTRVFTHPFVELNGPAAPAEPEPERAAG